jgi:hypothetical protein
MWLGVAPLTADSELSNVSAESLAANTNQGPMYVTVRAMTGPDVMPTQCAFATVGEQKFTFLVPDGFRVDVSSESRIVLVSRDFNSLITIRRAGPEWAAAYAAGAESLRSAVLLSYPGGVIYEQLSGSTDGQSGPAFGFRWKAGELSRHSYLAIIPTRVGLLEFNLTSSPEQFQSHRGCLDYVLLTFRSGNGGKFEYVQVFKDN